MDPHHVRTSACQSGLRGRYVLYLVTEVSYCIFSRPGRSTFRGHEDDVRFIVVPWPHGKFAWSDTAACYVPQRLNFFWGIEIRWGVWRVKIKHFEK